jgi:hypothetical protein
MSGIHDATAVPPSLQGRGVAMKPWVRYMGVLMLGMVIGAGASVLLRPDPCISGIREVSPSGIEVGSGSPRFGIRASLVGCRSDLEGVSSQEMSEVEELIRAALVEDNWMLWPRSKDPEYRAALTRRVNAVVGRHVATDVYLYGFSASE